ncbi:hypothetical protein LXA47_25425 [Massilia sp. P8910]|uniref:hypothetical protein n=1 Tax=Massilia antarctica TaxID=2765360 RepID=UPI001E54D328|nr:hypothetical protein [Massilia antarctica]MCE3606920.1 hypothetical protein [Massilia antarctica]
MRADALLDLIAKLEDCDVDAAAKVAFRKMIVSVGAMHNISCLKQEQRVDFARNLLRLREQRAVVRDRLIAQFRISESQANRDISTALVSHLQPTQKR